MKKQNISVIAATEVTVRGYDVLAGAIGRIQSVAYIEVGNNVAVVGCDEDGRLIRKDVRQIVEASWKEVYVADVQRGYKFDDVYKYIVKNAEVLFDLGFITDDIRCVGDFMPLVRKGYTAIPAYRMSGVEYLIVRDEVVSWTEEFLSKK